ncbi:MAG: carotenoid oxygenase family protein [Minicystis sp.]
MPTAPPSLHRDSGASRSLENLDKEHDFSPLRVEGRLPADLRGTLYRNGSGIFSQFGRRYQHWFDGDGLITALRLDGQGNAAGAVRFVDTPGRREERRRGRLLYGSFGTPSPRPIRQLVFGTQKNPANTSIFRHQDRLFALCEAGKPVEIAPETLATLGETDFEGAIPSTFSAHPHYVPSRRAHYNFGVRYGKKTMLDLFELPDVGAPRRLGEITLAGASMIHDFIVTERYLIFFVPPLRLGMLKVLLGLSSYDEALAWVPGEGTEVLIVPIDDPARVNRFTIEPFFQNHFANAFARGDDLVVDLVRYRDFAGFNGWVRDFTRGEVQREPGSSFHRMVLSPARQRLLGETRWDLSCEFPVAPPGTETQAYGTVLLAAHGSSEAARSGMFDTLCRLDIESGKTTHLDFGPKTFPSEPVHAGEYLLSLVYDAEKHTSFVAVVKEGRFEEGAVARVHFEHHVPLTFHGMWAAG